MATHIALLRGINVGGRNRVAMADLRAVVSGLGHTEVATYIQSGNVVFTSAETDTEALAAALEQAIASSLAVRPAVVVLSRDDLARAVRDNPYPAPDPKLLHAVFFRGPVPAGAAEAIEAGQRRSAGRGGGTESARIVGSTLFVHTPDGFGRSELALYLLGRPASPVATGTARNWSTVTRLLALCGGLSGPGPPVSRRHRCSAGSVTLLTRGVPQTPVRYARHRQQSPRLAATSPVPGAVYGAEVRVSASAN